MSKKFVSKEMASKIREKAKPFLAWLAEAEEESSEDDDDDIQVLPSTVLILSHLHLIQTYFQINFSTSARGAPVVTTEKPAGAAAAGGKAKADDEEFIDDI